MNNNFYIRFNHKNIIPFNLKKKKLRVHANIIGSKTTNLYGFFIGGEVKFWYYHFGINGLKKDSVFLVKKNLNKKLGVFFISNFNMVEGKWLFPKIYEQYYKYYLYLKKKKMNLFKTNLIISHNYNLLNNIFYIKFLNNINMNNVLKLIYFYNNYLNINMNIINNLSDLYKFKKKFKLSLLYNNVQNKNINLWDLSTVQGRFDNLKNFRWNWNFHLKHKIFKKKKISNMIRQKPFWFYQKKRWYFKQKSDLFFKKKWDFMMNKNYLNNFYLKKNIVNITQFIKMNRALNKVSKKNILFLFYVFYLHFNFIKLYKNLKKKKKKKNLIYYKFLKNNKVKELIKNNMCNIKKLYNFINFKLKKIYIKQTQLIFLKNINKQYKKKNFIKFFLILKKKIKKFYKFKFIKKNFILSNVNKYMFNNTYIMYDYLYKIWLRYNRKKKKIKLIKLYFLKKKYKKKYKKKFKYKNLYLLWLYYIIKRQFKNFK